MFSSQAFEDLTLETSDIGQKQPIESMGARGNAFPKKLITKRKVEAFFPKIEVLGLREEEGC